MSAPSLSDSRSHSDSASYGGGNNRGWGGRVPTYHQQQQRRRQQIALSEAGLEDPGCCFVWVQAVAKAKEDGRYGSRDRPTAGGAVWGRTDDVAPLNYLSDGLRELLCQQQM
ncbi:unnamed protein product, partial [Laminaria digitata]